MSNQQIIDAFYSLSYLKSSIKTYEDEIKYYGEKLESTKQLIELGEKVKEIYDSVPLAIEEVKGFTNDYIEISPIINKERKVNLIQQGSKYRVVLINNKEVIRLVDLPLDEGKELAYRYCACMSSPAEFKYDYERGFLK